VAVFGSERKAGKRNRKKKASCLKNWKLEADFTVVGVSEGSLLRCSAGLCGAKSKREKQQSQPETN